MGVVDLFLGWMKEQPLKGYNIEVVKLPNLTPLIFVEVESTIPGETKEESMENTVLMYGHFDKQPPLTDQWEESLHPYRPVLRGDKLYGRAGADDGYAFYAAITSLVALQQQGVPHGRAVIVIEGCEESGSAHLPAYIEHLAPRIGTPSLIVCLDSGCGNYDQMWLTTSLRGIVVGNLRVDILKEGVHSGKASGVVPSSFRIIRQLLDRVEDPKTGEILLSDLQVTIPPHRVEQAKEAAKELGNLVTEEFPFVEGAGAVDLPLNELILNKTWRPALSYTGAENIPSLQDAGNVLRTYTTLTLSLRVPPTLKAPEGAQRFKEALERDPPYGAKVSCNIFKSGSGWNSPELEPWLATAVQEASLAIFEKPTLYQGEGGSIPFMGMLGERFPKAQFVITGVLGPNSNAHGPNEFIHLPFAQKITSCVAYIVHSHATRPAQ